MGIEAADVERLVDQLTQDEKISLLAGYDFWHTFPVPRLGISSLRFSDGPNGLRGTKRFNAVPSACIPCATALAATFDVALIERVGAFLAKEAKCKGAHVLLAPTVNMQRSPLGGRGFESFSEDPHLSGHIAAAYIRGLQANGIGATIKHFACNDMEHERQKMDSLVPTRALREIYLMPFQIAQRHAKPWAYMTSYGSLNGVHCNESKELLQTILREEWGFDGLVMSDWYGTYSVSDSITAGCDLEMPGPALWRSAALVKGALASGKITKKDLNERAKNILALVARASASGIPERAPEVKANDPEDREFNRLVASSSIVLLKNDKNILPLSKNGLKKIAVIGPNGIIPSVSGGGSASLLPYYAVSALDGIKAAVGESVEVVGLMGVHAHKLLPVITSKDLRTKAGNPGFEIAFFNNEPLPESLAPGATVEVLDTNNRFHNGVPSTITETMFWARGTACYIPRTTGRYQFGLASAGRSRLFVDGKLLIDNWTDLVAGDTFMGCGTVEAIGEVDLEAGKAHDIQVIFVNDMDAVPRRDGVSPLPTGGFRLGAVEKIDDPDRSIDAAVSLAKDSDAVVLVVGLNGDWESEGWDRKDMDLPGLSNKLVSKVLSARPDSVLILQSGTPVSVQPFISLASTIVHSWFPGQEGGNAIADVLFGKVNPSGRLSVTFPKSIKHSPAYLNWGSENGKVLYGEGLFMGYRYFDEMELEPEFAFGFGLSYTTFEYSDLRISGTLTKDADLTVSVVVKNTGTRPGHEVVQLYVSDIAASLRRPFKELKAFAKPFLQPGESQEVVFSLDKYAVSFYDDKEAGWKVEAGEFKLIVASSSRTSDVRCETSFTLNDSYLWQGL
ncbi:beta-glucosidase precursor [Cladochytrium replicatum]|nr:beta-glucosidase precursor [Cladochytrium replicatum]